MHALLWLVLIVAIVVVLPFLLVAVVIDFGLWLLGIPFRLLGALVGLLGAVVAGAAALAATGIGLAATAVGLVAALLLLPLLPLAVIAVAAWLMVRRPRRAVSSHARP